MHFKDKYVSVILTIHSKIIVWAFPIGAVKMSVQKLLHNLKVLSKSNQDFKRSFLIFTGLPFSFDPDKSTHLHMSNLFSTKTDYFSETITDGTTWRIFMHLWMFCLKFFIRNVCMYFSVYEIFSFDLMSSNLMTWFFYILFFQRCCWLCRSLSFYCHLSSIYILC